MDAVGAFFLIVFLLIVLLLAIAIWTTVVAKRQHEGVTTLSPARTKQLIEKSFNSALWGQADGPGDINRRRRQMPAGRGAVVSVDIATLADGKTHVSSWVSATETWFGLVMSRGVSKPQKVIKLIESSQA